MAHIEIANGIVADDETGEIISGDQPGALDILAAHLLEASEQEKAWKARAAALKAVMMRQQEEPKRAYGDVVVSKRQSTRREQNTDGIRQWLRKAELSREELWTVIDAAREIDLQKLPLDWMPQLVEYDTARPNRPYIVVERARKAAPNAA